MTAHKQTDKLIQLLNNEISKQYQSAYSNSKKQLIEMLTMVNLTGTSNERYAEVIKYGRLEKLEDYITEQIRNANDNAVSLINKQQADIYKINYNEVAELLPKSEPIGTNESKQESKDIISPFNDIAIDKLKDTQSIKSDVSGVLIAAILGGLGINGIAKSLKETTEKNLNSSVTIAKVKATQTESNARIAVGLEAKKSGKKVFKKWVAILDDRTRDAHREANGQIVDIDDTFTVGGESLSQPCDPAGSPGNIINCRCTTEIIIQ